MKKVFYLLFFCFGFAAVSLAQQAKTPPKVTIVKYTPPARKGKPVKKDSKTKTAKPPKVDLSNYKPPAKKRLKSNGLEHITSLRVIVIFHLILMEYFCLQQPSQ